MSQRRLRFTDTEFKSSPRSYNRPNPCAHGGVPHFATVLQTLDRELQANRLYKDVWKQATDLFEYKKKTLPADYFKSTVLKECYIAVIAYTMDTELYRDFNTKFRQLPSAMSWPLFPYTSLYYLLTMARVDIQKNVDIQRRLYRGIANIHFDPPPKPGEYFYFDYFASCSTDEEVAMNFLGTNGTMVEIQDGAEIALEIGKYSQFEEEEVLVFPRSRFQVVKFEKGGTKDKLVLKRAGNVYSP